ncbi:MAG TPA: PKD domain-containing protein [Candidatus Thermoplasmatota archaeon]
MKAAIWSLSLLCVLAAFSGCADRGEKVEVTPTDVTPTATPSSSPTTSPTSSPTSTNTTVPEPTIITDPPPGPPVANLTADVVNGSIPVNVAFTIDDSSDEGGTYNWTVDFGDGNGTNGTGVPSVVTHSFMEIGTYAVNLTLETAAGSSNATINITANDFAAERWSGAWENGSLACVAGTQDEWQFSDFNGTSHAEFPVNNTTWNMTFSALFDPADSDERMVDFYDEDSALVATFRETENATVNGSVPQNATFIVLWACDPSGGGGSAEYAAAPQSEWDRQQTAATEDDA